MTGELIYIIGPQSINPFTARGNNTHLPGEIIEKLGGTQKQLYFLYYLSHCCEI